MQTSYLFLKEVLVIFMVTFLGLWKSMQELPSNNQKWFLCPNSKLWKNLLYLAFHIHRRCFFFKWRERNQIKKYKKVEQQNYPKGWVFCQILVDILGENSTFMENLKNLSMLMHIFLNNTYYSSKSLLWFTWSILTLWPKSTKKIKIGPKSAEIFY